MPVALLSVGLLAFGLQPADAAGSGNSPRPVVAKLDGGLQLLASAAASGRPVTAQTGASTADGSATVTGGARIVDGDVLVDVYVDGPLNDAIAALQSLGLRVTATNDRAPQQLVSGWLAASKLLEATAVSGVRAVRAVHAGLDAADGTDTGSVLSQGDAAHHGPQARALGTTGSRVKVGVISDSINQVSGGVASSQATGNLPAGTHVILDDTQPGIIDEGRAMAEIIYDEAPGITDLYFSTGTMSAAGKATSINNLVSAGVKVIADDIFYLDEPMFQDGQVAQAVDAAEAAGVNYFASAGNRAKQSWEGTYTGTTDHDFDPSAGTDTVQTLGTFTNRSPFISLQWAEPWGDATTDLALDFYVDGVLVPAQTDTDNIASGIPNEFEAIDIAGTHMLGIGIRRVAGTGTPFMKYIVGGVPSGTTFTEYATNSNAINPDAASAAGSLAVAASNWSTPTTPEPYSSRGPAITRLFTAAGAPTAPIVRAKPALDAADGVATTVPALVSFSGTSASTPAAAGIATLIRSGNPPLTNDDVAAIMTDPANAQACATATPATDCGSGFVMADLAVADAGVLPLTATPSVTTAAPTSSSTSTTPAITGTAEAGSTVTLYANNTCTGPALGSGTAMAFQGAGVTAAVPANATTTIFAQATKAAQRDSECSATSVSYTHDSLAPDTTITSTFPGGVAKSLSVPISFTSTEAGSTFQCMLDSGTFAGCTSPSPLTVSSGPHTLTVKATDGLGNTDATPATVSFTAYDCTTLAAAAQAAASQVSAAEAKVAKAKKALKRAKKSGKASKVKKAKKKLKKAKAALKAAQTTAAAAQQAAAPCS